MLTMQRKKLPIGIQTFAKIREDGAYYYVDKTPQALQLIAQGSHFFCRARAVSVKVCSLTRSRRFLKGMLHFSMDCTQKKIGIGQLNIPSFDSALAGECWDQWLIYSRA